MLSLNISELLFLGVAMGGWLILGGAFALYVMGSLLSRYHAEEEEEEQLPIERVNEVGASRPIPIQPIPRAGRVIPFPAERIRA